MLAKSTNQQIITGDQANLLFWLLQLDDRFPLKQENELMLLLVIPEIRRGTMTTGNNPLDPHLFSNGQAFDELITEALRYVAENIAFIHTTYGPSVSGTWNFIAAPDLGAEILFSDKIIPC